MIVSHTAKVLFVHVQKTGGVTIDTVLRRTLPDAEAVKGVPGTRHARLGPTLRKYPEFADYRIFGFVRNPWARLYSWHAMIMRIHAGASQGREKQIQNLRRNGFWARSGEKFPDFESFVLRGPDEFKRLRTPQVNYLRSKSREADHIGRTENLAEDLEKIMAALEIPYPQKLPHKNAGPRGDYREHYTLEMRDRVADVFGPDLEEFGYQF